MTNAVELIKALKGEVERLDTRLEALFPNNNDDLEANKIKESIKDSIKACEKEITPSTPAEQAVQIYTTIIRCYIDAIRASYTQD